MNEKNNLFLEKRFKAKTDPISNLKYYKILISILILFIIFLSIIITICIKDIKKSIDIINSHENEIQRLESSLSYNIENFNNDIENYKEQLSFYENYIAICPNDHSKLYHIYDCSNLDLSSFYIYTVDEAKKRGYQECSNCYNFYLKYILNKYNN